MKKYLGYILILIGLIIIILNGFSDLLRGRSINFGVLQIIVFLGGIVFIILGILGIQGKLLSYLEVLFFKIEPYINQGFSKKNELIFDALITLILIVCSILFFLGRWDGLNPILLVDKNGDAGALLSYAISQDNPGFFSHDQFLDPQLAYVSYDGIYLPYISAVGKLLGNYGLGYLTLLPICVFLYTLSSYLIGKKLLGNRFWAVIFTLINTVSISYGFFDSWGIIPDPLPRFVFQSIAPFLFLWFFTWIERPSKWFWLMLIASLFFFIHVISTGALFFLLWTSFFLFFPKTWTKNKILLSQLINFLAFFVPFSIFILLSKSSMMIKIEPTQSTYSDVMSYLASNFGGFLNIKASFKLFIQVLHSYYLVIPSLVSILLILLFKKFRSQKIKMVLLLLSDIFFISLIIPMIEHGVENYFKIIPFQIDLVRNLRYSIPLLMILIISGMIILQNQIKALITNRFFKCALIVSIYLLGCFWSFLLLEKDYLREKNRGYDFLVQEIRCVRHGNLFCPTKMEISEEEMLLFIKNETPTSSVFLSVPGDQFANEIRFGAMRAVAYTSMDKNRIVYKDFIKSVQIENIYQLWQIKESENENQFADWLYQFSCTLEVSHWVLENGFNENYAKLDFITIIFDNGDYAVAQLKVCPNLSSFISK